MMLLIYIESKLSSRMFGGVGPPPNIRAMQVNVSHRRKCRAYTCLWGAEINPT